MKRRLLSIACILLLVSLSLAQTPIPIKPADFPRAADTAQKPPIGINLEQLVDYSRSMMFVDLIKGARKFGSAAAPWDEKAPVDDHGWPTSDAGLVVVADAPLPPGDYAFACTGHCVLETVASKASVKNQSWNADTQTTTATVTQLGRSSERALGR